MTVSFMLWRVNASIGRGLQTISGNDYNISPTGRCREFSDTNFLPHFCPAKRPVRFFNNWPPDIAPYARYNYADG